MPLAIDCQGKYSPAAAIKIANRSEKYKLWWLEDPVPFFYIEAEVVSSHEAYLICFFSKIEI